MKGKPSFLQTREERSWLPGVWFLRVCHSSCIGLATEWESHSRGCLVLGQCQATTAVKTEGKKSSALSVSSITRAPHSGAALFLLVSLFPLVYLKKLLLLSLTSLVRCNLKCTLAFLVSIPAECDNIPISLWCLLSSECPSLQTWTLFPTEFIQWWLKGLGWLFWGFIFCVSLLI